MSTTPGPQSGSAPQGPRGPMPPRGNTPPQGVPNRPPIPPQGNQPNRPPYQPPQQFVSPNQVPPDKKKSKKPWLIGAGIVAVLAIIGGMMGGEDDGAQPVAAPTTAVASKAAEAPKTTKTTEKKVSATDKVREAVVAKLGDGNREGVERVKGVTMKGDKLIVQWAINDNLTSNLLRIGTRNDVRDILRAIRESGVKYDTVEVRGTFSMKDKLGNVTESRVVTVDYPKSIVDKIQFDTFDTENIWDIGVDAFVHNEFR